MLWCRDSAWSLAALLLLSLAVPSAGAGDSIDLPVGPPGGNPGGDTGAPVDPPVEEEEPLPMKLGFVCDSGAACCGAHIAMARLAVQHVNNKNAGYVPQLADLPENDTMPRLEITEILFSEDMDPYTALTTHYLTLAKDEQPVAVIGVLRTDEVEEISQLSQQFDVPVFTVASAGALGLQGSSQEEYSNIYRMVAPVYEIARVLVSLFQAFGFEYAAVFYDPNVEEENRVLNEIIANSTGTGIQFEKDPIHVEPGADLTESVDALLRKHEFGGVKTFVLLLQDTYKIQLVMERAYRLGLAGDKPGAEGSAWIAATGSAPWELPDAVPAEHLGMLAIQQHLYDHELIKKMKKEWKEVMPRGCGLSPENAKFSTIMRNHMPYEMCVGLANSYDSVIALALAEARLVSQDADDVERRRLQKKKASSRPRKMWSEARRLNQQPTRPWDDFEEEFEEYSVQDRCEGLELGSKSLELNQVLREGVYFRGLSGIVDRMGNPWEEKEGVWDVLNKNELDNSIAVLRWTEDTGLQVHEGNERRLTNRAHPRRVKDKRRQLTDFVVPGLIWPGNLTAEEQPAPPKFEASTCLSVDCGNFGECQTRPAIGRRAGWCKCNSEFYGRRCDVFYEPYRLVDHPNIEGEEPTNVTVLPLLHRFQGVDSDEGTFKVTVHTLLMWSDNRVSQTLNAGHYTADQALALKREGLLWLPTKHTRRLSSSVELGGDFYITYIGEDEHNYTEDVKLALLLQGEYEITADMDWRAFPFDEQELEMHIIPDGSYEARFVLGNCGMADMPETVIRECTEMEELGVPDRTLETWPSLWRFLGASLYIEAGGIKLNLDVQRDASTFTLRILIPSIFLVVISWAGFYINPKTLMPRFASSFISFLALQTFKTNAQKLTPADAAMITWTDVYMSAVGILMVFAVIENMFVPFANEHWAERSALFIDCYSRASFPVVFTAVIVVMITLRDAEYLPSINLAVHLWLVIFTLVSICVAIWEFRTFKQTIIQRELRRVKNAVKKQANVKLTMLPVELKSIFLAIDDDGSGIVEAEEIFPYLATRIKALTEADVSTMQQKLKHDLGEAFYHGVALDKFEPLFTKVMYMMVDHDYKHYSSHNLEADAARESKKDGHDEIDEDN